jgi:hypothetical protein
MRSSVLPLPVCFFGCPNEGSIRAGSKTENHRRSLRTMFLLCPRLARWCSICLCKSHLVAQANNSSLLPSHFLLSRRYPHTLVRTRDLLQMFSLETTENLKKEGNAVSEKPSTGGGETSDSNMLRSPASWVSISRLTKSRSSKSPRRPLNPKLLSLVLRRPTPRNSLFFSFAPKTY